MFDFDYYFEHDFDFTDLENSFLKLVSEQGQITDTVKKEYKGGTAWNHSRGSYQPWHCVGAG